MDEMSIEEDERFQRAVDAKLATLHAQDAEDHGMSEKQVARLVSVLAWDEYDR